RALTVSTAAWMRAAQQLAAGGGRLAAMWATRGEHVVPTVRAGFLINSGALPLSLPPPPSDAPYPAPEGYFPPPPRMQRAMADLSGVRASDSDTRPWLRHNAWPASYRPLIDPATLLSGYPIGVDQYPFVRVSGEGVHEIPVGPVHAGIIEPGHFRFS